MRTAIRLRRGDDEIRLITLKHQSDTAFDLSDLARADLHAVADKQRVLELSTVNSLIKVINEAEGEILINIPHNLTENSEWKIADYDLQLTFSDGKIKTVLEGQIHLLQDVTRVSDE